MIGRTLMDWRLLPAQDNLKRTMSALALLFWTMREAKDKETQTAS